MKACFVVLCLTALVIAIPVYGQDTIGLYTNTAGTNTELSLSGTDVVSLYLILKDPSNTNRIDGWECALPTPSGFVIPMDVYLYGGAINVGVAPNYIVGIPFPGLDSSDNIILGMFNYLVMDPAPSEFFIEAASPSSLYPPNPCYFPGNSLGAVIPLTPSSGSVYVPVFHLNAQAPQMITVNPDGSGDYPTIREAVANARGGDTILLGDGVFVGPDNRDISFNGLPLTIRSNSGDAEACIIDCENLGRAFEFTDGEVYSSVIEGITIENGNTGGPSDGGGIRIGIYGGTPTSPTIRGCIFRNNTSGHIGGAIAAVYMSDPLVTDCLFYGNTSATYGGAWANDFYSFPRLLGCTFFENTAGYDGGGVYSSSGGLTVSNCIIWHNECVSGPQVGMQNGTEVTIDCCDIEGGEADIHAEGTLVYGAGNITADPLFCDPDAAMFTLTLASPCRPANNGCGVLMGAYGGGCSVNPEPHILRVADVPNDQGGQVRLTWYGSLHDDPASPSPITGYDVFRRIDATAAALVRTPEKMLGWDYVTHVPARGEEGYEVVVPTLCDSTMTDGLCWSVFLVSAATADQFVFFDSPPDSGWSVDNLSPEVPAKLAVAYAAAGNVLTWAASEAPDLARYEIWRTQGSTPPSPLGEPDAVVTTEEWTDADFGGSAWQQVYWVAAVDHAGNRSGLTDWQTADISGVGGEALPQFVTLGANVPNPFNPMTTLYFELPRAAQVDLAIYDIAGRLVRRLVVAEPYGQGPHEVVWRGTNDTGRTVASGVYFSRLRALGEERIGRMVLLK